MRRCDTTVLAARRVAAYCSRHPRFHDGGAEVNNCWGGFSQCAHTGSEKEPRVVPLLFPKSRLTPDACATPDVGTHFWLVYPLGNIGAASFDFAFCVQPGQDCGLCGSPVGSTYSVEEMLILPEAFAHSGNCAWPGREQQRRALKHVLSSF